MAKILIHEVRSSISEVILYCIPVRLVASSIPRSLLFLTVVGGGALLRIEEAWDLKSNAAQDFGSPGGLSLTDYGSGRIVGGGSPRGAYGLPFLTAN